MGISKVEINNADGTKNVLVDLTGDTVTADMLAKGVTAHGADGENITGVVEEIKDNSGEPMEMVMPGDNVLMTVELIAPIAIENGTKFSIREGGRTVGSGNVTEIVK